MPPVCYRKLDNYPRRPHLSPSCWVGGTGAHLCPLLDSPLSVHFPINSLYITSYLIICPMYTWLYLTVFPLSCTLHSSLINQIKSHPNLSIHPCSISDSALSANFMINSCSDRFISHCLSIKHQTKLYYLTIIRQIYHYLFHRSNHSVFFNFYSPLYSDKFIHFTSDHISLSFLSYIWAPLHKTYQ